MLVQHHLHHLHQGRQYAYVDDEIEKAQVKLPEEGAVRAQYMAVDQVVEGNGDHHDHQHRHAKTEGGVDVLRHREEGTHAEKEGQGQVFHKDRLNKQIDVIVHEGCSPLDCAKRGSAPDQGPAAGTG
ncbi:hypothetical protein D3C85_915810 [compost metagenome]